MGGGNSITADRAGAFKREAANCSTTLANSTSTSSEKASLGNDSAGTGCRQHIGYRKGMAIASLNVDGLLSHLDEIKVLVNNVGMNILALNETKLDPNYPNELSSIAGYQQERPEKTCNGGRVSVYIRDCQIQVSF